MYSVRLGPWAAWGVLATAFLACQGTIAPGPATSGEEGHPSGGNGGTGGTAAVPPNGMTPAVDTPAPAGTKYKFDCADPQARGTSDGFLRRLTRPELVATLTDLLGADVVADAGIQAQFDLLTDDRIVRSVSDVAETPPDTQPSAMFSVALRAAELVLAGDAAVKRVFGSCASATAMTDACLTSFVSSFGARVYRRPVTAAESQALLAQYRAAGGNAEGMIRVLGRLLMSPSLVYHLEPGAGVSGARVRLTDFEVASRLAYRLTGTMPDAALMQAAGDGSLQTVAGVKAQARRLAATTAARDRLSDFFRFYMQEDSVRAPNKFAATLAGIDPADLDSEMVQEMNDFIANVTWARGGRFKDLLTGTEVFPRSAGMAKILEAGRVTAGGAPTTTNAGHAGLVLRPGFLAGSADLTSPYHRALVVRSSVLCETFSIPDPAIISQRQQQLGDLSTLSNRARLTMETNAPACLGCHALLNPVAFVLESYDQLGMKRTVESDFDDKTGAVVGTHPIDTVVTDTHIDDGTGNVASFRDATDLVRALSTGLDARACFAQRIFEYQRIRAETAADGCALREVEDAASDRGTIVDAFVAGVANEDIFYRAQGR